MNETFIINTLPVAKGRPRCTRQGRAYTPTKTRNAEEEFKTILSTKWKHGALENPIMLSVVFYVPMPKSWSKSKKLRMLGEPCAKRPDLDNYIKLIMDAMNGICYKDDGQVWAVTMSKQYSNTPKIEVQIMDYDY